jgi:hypothetical protein
VCTVHGIYVRTHVVKDYILFFLFFVLFVHLRRYFCSYFVPYLRYLFFIDYIKKGNFRCRFCIVFFVSSLGITFGASTMVRLLCYCAFDALIVNDVNVPPHASPPFTSLIFNEQLPGTQYTGNLLRTGQRYTQWLGAIRATPKQDIETSSC